MSVNIIVTESVIKTDYYISLYGNKKVSNITVDIDIDEHFVNLYFSIQDNLKEILNSVVDNGEYDIYDVMCIINDFFYIGVNPLFPFEIAVYLIKNGYKEHFINDSYYLALLYETPEIYNVVIKNIENNCLDEDLIYLHDDSLSYKNIDINKYDDYVISIYPMELNKDGNINMIMNKSRFTKNVITLSMDDYDDNINGNIKDYVLNILSLKGVAVCGSHVDSLLYNKTKSKVYGDDDAITKTMVSPTDVDIFFYGDMDGTKIIETISDIIGIIYNNNRTDVLNVSHSDEFIIIGGPHGGYSTSRKYKLGFKIKKKLYKNVSDILSETDVDSNTCALFQKDGEIVFGYLPRYKFAVENRINIVNPYNSGESYNKNLIKACENGYRLFIPGAIHLIRNYFGNDKIYPENSLQSLLNMLLNYRKRPNNKDIDVVKRKLGDVYIYDKSLKYIFNASKIYKDMNLPTEFDDFTFEEIDEYLLQMAGKDRENFSLSNIVNSNVSAYGVYFSNIEYIDNVLSLINIAKNWDVVEDIHVNNSKNDYLSLYNLKIEKSKYHNNFTQVSNNDGELLSID